MASDRVQDGAKPVERKPLVCLFSSSRSLKHVIEPTTYTDSSTRTRPQAQRQYIDLDHQNCHADAAFTKTVFHIFELLNLCQSGQELRSLAVKTAGNAALGLFLKFWRTIDASALDGLEEKEEKRSNSMYLYHFACIVT